MAGNASEVETAGVLVALRTKGETVDEIVGLATTMRAFATPVDTGRDDLIDTAGTGGGRPTFNVSTTAALIAAGARLRRRQARQPLRHRACPARPTCWRRSACASTSSRTRSPAASTEVGFGFMFAPAHHGATRFVVPVRKELAVRTIFNFLGPLTNPAGATRQVIGVSDPAFLETIAGALARLGARKALVVSSADGLDEMSTSGTTRVVEVDGEQVRAYDVAPEDVGLPRADPGRSSGGTPDVNAADDAPHLRRRAGPGARRGGAQRRRGDLRVRHASTASRRACAPPRRRSTTAAPPPRSTPWLTSPRSWRRHERARPHRRRHPRRGEAPAQDGARSRSSRRQLERRAEGFRPFSEALTRPGRRR